MGLAIAVTSDDCLVATLKGGIDRNISVMRWPVIIRWSRPQLIADPKRVGDHAGKGRIRQQADELFIIGADDRHFLGGHSRPAASVEHLNAANIRAGHDARGLGQFFHPLGHALDFIFPRGLLVAP